MFPVRSLGGFYESGQAALEFPPVNEPGQRVMARLPDQLLRHGPDLADVVKYHDHAQHPVMPAADRLQGIANWTFAAVAIHQPHRSRIPFLARTRGIHSKRFDGPARSFIDHTVDLFQRLAVGLRCEPSGVTLRDRIQVFNPACGVGGDHAIAYRMQGNLRQFLFKLQFIFSAPHLAHDQGREKSRCKQDQHPHSYDQQDDVTRRATRLRYFVLGGDPACLLQQKKGVLYLVLRIAAFQDERDPSNRSP